MPDATTIDSALLAVLACPRDHSELHHEQGRLRCALGHDYPIVGGIPVFLLAEHQQTIGIAAASLQAAQSSAGAPLYLDTLGLSEDEKRGIEKDWRAGADIDAAISYLIGATSGLAYVKLIGQLRHYPIPDIPIEGGAGEWLLDVGSNWGRWSVAAARKGWRAVGIDPSLGALMAAKRAFSATTPEVFFICGDARYLPFKAEAFRGAFSYSVLQHFSETDAERTIAEIGRVLRHGGFAKIQMAHEGGLRSAHVRARRREAEAGVFRVRYWSLRALRTAFEKFIGPVTLTAEAYGGLGLLAEDRKYLAVKSRLLVSLSVLLKTIARRVPSLVRLADSIYATAIKR